MVLVSSGRLETRVHRDSLLLLGSSVSCIYLYEAVYPAFSLERPPPGQPGPWLTTSKLRCVERSCQD
jgi:hypothetical protein